jgi:ubiquinol-cytochrome c reductase cytochrome b subunit
VLFGVLGILAVLWPPEVGPAPVMGIEVTKPPWNFWWMFTLENLIGLPGIMFGSATLFLLLIILPFIDRNPARHWRQRPVATTIALLVLLAIATLTILMAFATAKTHLGM